jgi:hypothetical protein
MNRSDINDCPAKATHVKLNPSGEFIEMFYRVNEHGVIQYQSFSGSWCFSMESERDKNFMDRLIEIK